MRVVTANNKKEIEGILRDLKVDPYGIKIMLPKAMGYLIRIDSISCILANILKQEMLSLGGDAALPRDVLTGRLKLSPCLLIGNLSQYSRLTEKLKFQPFGLAALAKEIKSALCNYQKNTLGFKAGKYRFNINTHPLIMGILNLTPDSFSGDGMYQKQALGISRQPLSAILAYAQRMIRDGADIIDVGGESTRPGARPVSIKEEVARTIPVIKLIVKNIKTPVSIDTYKPEVAKQALDSGAVIVNDITGLRNSGMRRIIAKYKAGAIIMHMRGKPYNMQNNPRYTSLLNEITVFLSRQIAGALDAGIAAENIAVDPGIGFGKTVEHNLEIIKKLSELKVLGRPIVIGPSRKSFIGKILKAKPQERLSGTISAAVLGANNGANILRVHDVSEVAKAVRIAEAILN